MPSVVAIPLPATSAAVPPVASALPAAAAAVAPVGVALAAPGAAASPPKASLPIPLPTWDAGKLYAPGDCVRDLYPPHDNYFALQENDGTDPQSDFSGEIWRRLLDWNPATEYEAGDRCIYNGRIFKAIQASDGIPVSNAAYWAETLPLATSAPAAAPLA